ncbi:MAG: NADH-quinone oxidoreductase subunit A [Candidatus Manganitrophaceae bacterium]
MTQAPSMNYIPIFIFLMASIAFGVGTLVFSYLVQPRIYNREKLTTYECGSEPISDARIPFPVRYYIIAMLFVIFDIEIAFLYPWAVAFNRIGIFGFISMLLFIALFLIGYIYAWKKEGLEWD